MRPQRPQTGPQNGLGPALGKTGPHRLSGPAQGEHRADSGEGRFAAREGQEPAARAAGCTPFSTT